MKAVILYEAEDGKRFNEMEDCYQYDLANRNLRALRELEKASIASSIDQTESLSAEENLCKTK